MPEEKEYLDSEENLVPMPKLNKRLKFKIIHSEEKEVLEAEDEYCPQCNELKLNAGDLCHQCKMENMMHESDQADGDFF